MAAPDLNLSQYEGIPYKQGVNDCYSIVQKFFKDQAGVALKDYIAPSQWWMTPGLNLLFDNFSKEGFEVLEIPVTDLKIGDCFLIASGTRIPSHCGVYTGSGKFLHHPFGKLSLVELYRGAWKRMTLVTLRHKIACFPQPEYTTKDIMDFLLPHKRALFVDQGAADHQT